LGLNQPIWPTSLSPPRGPTVIPARARLDSLTRGARLPAVARLTCPRCFLRLGRLRVGSACRELLPPPDPSRRAMARKGGIPPPKFSGGSTQLPLIPPRQRTFSRVNRIPLTKSVVVEISARARFPLTELNNPAVPGRRCGSCAPY
jgi:hypothetical protein